MHEFAITQGILDVTLKGAKEQGAIKINTVYLKVGAMSDIVDDCVQFYFEQLSKGTIAEGAQLQVEKVPARAKCNNCQAEFEPEEFFFQCSSCGQFGAQIISGKELEVSSLDIETEP